MVSNIRILYVKAHTVGIYIMSAMTNLNSQFYWKIFPWIALACINKLRAEGNGLNIKYSPFIYYEQFTSLVIFSIDITQKKAVCNINK